MRTISVTDLKTTYSAKLHLTTSFLTWKLLLPVLLLALLVYPTTSDMMTQVLTDTLFQVSAFVAATLFIYHHFSRRFPSLELSYLQEHSPRLEILTAAVLGMIPGCGGAIVVVTQFTKGRASFGAVIAVLIATMGDGAFLLLTSKPLTTLGLMLLSLTIGFCCGVLVNRYFQPVSNTNQAARKAKSSPHSIGERMSGLLWKVGLLPIVALAILIALNISLDNITPVINSVGVLFSLLGVFFWAIAPRTEHECCVDETHQSSSQIMQKVAAETHFISVWVILSFLAFELLQLSLGIDLKLWFSQYAVFAPLFAAAIGLIPGCGPQIVVITLYIQGILPFSALVANAISNDGDALFPALALAPKAATLASLLTTIPALLVGYLVFFIFER